MEAIFAFCFLATLSTLYNLGKPRVCTSHNQYQAELLYVIYPESQFDYVFVRLQCKTELRI